MTEDMLIGEEAITTMMEEIIQLFGMIYTTGIMIWSWLTTPLVDTAGAEALGFLGELSSYTPFELMFGIGIFVVLVYQLVKFIIGI